MRRIQRDPSWPENVVPIRPPKRNHHIDMWFVTLWGIVITSPAYVAIAIVLIYHFG